MFLEQLKQGCGKNWPAIARAKDEAEKRLEQIRQMLQQEAGHGGTIDSEDISIAVFGSLARGEWTSGSDLDWTLLIDGEADHEHANTAHRLKRLLEDAKFVPPGATGIFGNLSFSHALIHEIGGHDDTNRNTTQRMLLLLESRPVDRSEAYQRVVLGILRRYLQNDFRPFRLKIPRFLLNDLHRFWRTMCVDYASKYRERAGRGWAVRNIKLRMSRKLIFGAGLITCFSCDPELLAQRNDELASQPTIEGMVEYLRGFVERTPLDIVAEALTRWAHPPTADALLTAYDTFLSRLDDEGVRQHLSELRPEDAANDQPFRELQEHCDNFEKALERLFFDENPQLGKLTRKYGVF